MVLNAALRKMVTVSIILVFLFSAFAAIPAVATEPGTDPNGQMMVIKGTVYDGTTQKPLTFGVVYLWNDVHEYKAEIAEQGTFVFKVPHSGYKIKVQAEGYYPVEDHIEKTESTEIALRFVLKPVEARPDPMYVFGLVFDGVTNEPLPEAHLIFHGANNEFKVFTDEGGKFEIKLPPGLYKVEVFRQGYYEQVLEVSGEANDKIELSIEMKPIPDNNDRVLVGVSGIVLVADSDRPIPGAWVIAKSENGHLGRAIADDHGKFYMELPEGKYEVHAGADGFKDGYARMELLNVREYYLEIFCEVLSDDATPVVGTLKGLVFDATTNEPIGGAIVMLYRLSPRSDIREEYKARTNDDGTFVIEELPAGTYHMIVKAEGYEPYEAKIDVRYGKVSNEDPGMKLEFLDGKVAYVKVPLKPVLEKERPRLSGTVYDAGTNRPIQAEVILEPEFVMPKLQYLLLGIRWGQIPCDDSVNKLSQWDGFIQVTKGHVIPVRTVAWETGGNYREATDDLLYRQTNPMTLEWRSSTIPCWDGLIVLIVVPANANPAPHVTIHTEKWSHVFEFSDIVDIHREVTVDDMGNKVEIGTKLIKPPLCDCDKPLERPKLPPADEPPKDPPQKPDDRPNNMMPPEDGDMKTRGETDEDAKEAFALRIPDEQLREIQHKICAHYREIQGQPIVTSTNDKGWYAFWKLPSGHYRMLVIAPDHIEYYNEFTIKDGDHLKVDVYLRPMERPEPPVPPERPDRDPNERPCGRVIEGRVMHARTQEGIAGAKLTFERMEPLQTNDAAGLLMENGQYVEMETRTFETYTNERGLFEIKLPCGYYKLVVQARGYAMHTMRVQVTQDGPEALKILLKPSLAEDQSDESDERPRNFANTEDTDSGVDAKNLGVQVLDSEDMAPSMTGLLVALLILGLLLPVFFIMHDSKARKQQKKTKKPVKRTVKRVVKKK